MACRDGGAFLANRHEKPIVRLVDRIACGQTRFPSGAKSAATLFIKPSAVDMRAGKMANSMVLLPIAVVRLDEIHAVATIEKNGVDT